MVLSGVRSLCELCASSAELNPITKHETPKCPGAAATAACASVLVSLGVNILIFRSEWVHCTATVTKLFGLVKLLERLPEKKHTK